MARPEDLDQVTEMADNRRVIRESWFFPRGALEGWIRRGRMRVAELDGRVVGFIHFSPKRIHFLAVHPTYRNQGIGSDLVKSVNASTVWALESGKGFWERLGFIETTKKKKGKKPKVLMIKLGPQTKMEDYYEGDKA